MRRSEIKHTSKDTHATKESDMTLFENTYRRTLLKHAIAGLLTLCFIQVADAEVVPVPTTVRAVKNEGAKPRNVVFILSDDHRYDAMSSWTFASEDSAHGRDGEEWRAFEERICHDLTVLS